MSNAMVNNRTFQELVDTMAEIRRAGGSSMVKRENFTDFPEINHNIEFEKENYFEFASFGYVERLIRKLAAHFGSQNASEKFLSLKILNFREACGFFAGELALYLDNPDRESFEHVKFAWEGKGEIEDTWDNFTQWEVTKKK